VSKNIDIRERLERN